MGRFACYRNLHFLHLGVGGHRLLGGAEQQLVNELRCNVEWGGSWLDRRLDRWGRRSRWRWLQRTLTPRAVVRDVQAARVDEAGRVLGEAEGNTELAAEGDANGGGARLVAQDDQSSIPMLLFRVLH
eukprot:CAMPEP_0183335826 /NCGR_PEP_ID=MMETSP0164_2-20130417/3996_1 /TAXON_ID=221442 /ORGANISM="Coccolithus pelagicus ssp braarudi, Strain PLY182g" /LENGTH=126 /DNA_ID=CAMNT_0025505243 /DNA_START=284 /DNA_END=661 /DNA_ORIENTATION=+